MPEAQGTALSSDGREAVNAFVDAAMDSVYGARLRRVSTVREDCATVIEFLRSLPVDQRMEAMGMVAVTKDYDGIHIESGAMDGRTVDDQPEDSTLYLSPDGLTYMHVWDEDRCIHCAAVAPWAEEEADA